jgi:hypothetical protein
MKMTNTQSGQAPAKQQKLLKKFKNSSMKTIAKHSMSWDQLWMKKTITLAQSQLAPSSQ